MAMFYIVCSSLIHNLGNYIYVLTIKIVRNFNAWKQNGILAIWN